MTSLFQCLFLTGLHSPLQRNSNGETAAMVPAVVRLDV